MTNKKTALTLALVAYEKADVIGLVIESAARGSVVPDLVVVSDDGSGDGTADVAEAACQEAGLPSRILRHPRVGEYRLQTMRNSAIAEALEGVVVLSDSDCIFAPETFAAHLAIHERFGAAVGTGTRFEYLAGTSGDFTSMYSTLEFAQVPRSNYMVPYGANLSFTKRLWRDLGGFDRSYEGRYGFDDHEFVLRAEKGGATIYSDPGAYLFHCPHETIFGGRDPGSNAVLFNQSYGCDYGAEEDHFIRAYVSPRYWAGQRKATLLDIDLELDEWGAPPGYHPPLHIELTRSTRRLTPLVQACCDRPNESNRHALAEQVAKVQIHRMLPYSPGERLLTELRRLLRSHELGRGGRRLRESLDRWLRWQAAVEEPGALADSA